MATSRYTFVSRISGERIATTDVSSRIYFACLNNFTTYREVLLKENQRLDHIAAESYGDGTMWWIIAAASGIGWSLQCPPGTLLRIPSDLNQIYELLR